jgi:hypothetical protein
MKRVDDKTYIILNRKYKPLGQLTDEWVNYETHPSIVKLNITNKIAKELSVTNDDDLECIYFFQDTPMTLSDKKELNNYLERLGILAKLKIKN